MQDLQVSLEVGAGLQRTVKVEVSAERIDREVESRLRSVGRTANIKGFRPGKVPGAIVRQRYGEQVRREVLQQLLESTCNEAVTSQNLRPVGDLHIDTQDAADQPGRALAYTASFEVYPDFQVQGVDALTVSRPEPAIEEADVTFVIDNLRRQRVEWLPADRVSQEGDRVTIDFDGRIDGQPLEGGKGRDVQVVLGSGQLIPDFERQLAGHTRGDTFTMRVAFPADYAATELAGREADFDVTVKEVAEEHLPAVDEDFIRGFGIESGQEEDFRREINDNMQHEFGQRADAKVRQQIFEKLLESNPIDVPDTLVRREMGVLQAEAMRNMGISDPAAGPEAESFRPTAERRVRLGLVIGAVIREQAIKVDRARVQNRIRQMIGQHPRADDVLKAYMKNAELMQQVENAVIEDQVVDWLASQASVTPRPSSFRDLVTTP